MFDNYPQAAMEKSTRDVGLDSQVTLTMRLNNQIQEVEERAKMLRRVKEILEKNPELEELMGILRRVHI